MARAAEKGHSPGGPMGQALWKVSEPQQTMVVTILADQHTGHEALAGTWRNAPKRESPGDWQRDTA